VISLNTSAFIIFVKAMKTRGYPCKNERQPVEDRIDTLRIYYMFDGRSMIDYVLIFGKIREEIVRETVNEHELSSEGQTIIYPQSSIVILDIVSQKEIDVSGFPFFEETRTRWMFLDNYGWLMVWRKIYEHSIGYSRLKHCVQYELPSDALKIYKGLKVKVTVR
jgi:hypothetical protein